MLGAVISAVCIVTPTVQARLEEMRPGRLQRLASAAGGGGSFLLAEDLTDEQRKVGLHRFLSSSPNIQA